MSQRVYSKSRNQYGVLVSDARLDTAAYRRNDPNAVPHYNVLFDKLDAVTLPETDLRPVLTAPDKLSPPVVTTSGWEQVSAWATKHGPLLGILAALFAAALAAVVQLITAK